MALRRAHEPRRGTPSVLLIVGLANPGSAYEGSRHNVGGDAVRLLATRRGARLTSERRQRSESVTLTTSRGPVTLAVPITFMNESGAAVAPLVRRTSLANLEHLVVVHDELDLEPGRLQLKRGGGLAGHNGLRSIATTLKTQEFCRLRIGIGKPLSKDAGVDYVLARATGQQKVARDETIARAADALELLLSLEFDEAQQRVNAS